MGDFVAYSIEVRRKVIEVEPEDSINGETEEVLAGRKGSDRLLNGRGGVDFHRNFNGTIVGRGGIRRGVDGKFIKKIKTVITGGSNAG